MPIEEVRSWDNSTKNAVPDELWLSNKATTLYRRSVTGILDWNWNAVWKQNIIPSFLSEESLIYFIRNEVKTSATELWLNNKSIDAILEIFWFIGWVCDKKLIYEIFDFCNSEIKEAGASKPLSKEEFYSGSFSPKIYVSSDPSIFDTPKNYLWVLSHEIFHTVFELYMYIFDNNTIGESFENLETKKLVDTKHEILAYMHGANFVLKNPNLYSSSDVHTTAWNWMNTEREWYNNAAKYSSNFINYRIQLHNLLRSQEYIFQIFCTELNNFIINVPDLQLLDDLVGLFNQALKTNKLEDFLFYLQHWYNSPDLKRLYNNEYFRVFREKVLRSFDN